MGGALIDLEVIIFDSADYDYHCILGSRYFKSGTPHPLQLQLTAINPY